MTRPATVRRFLGLRVSPPLRLSAAESGPGNVLGGRPCLPVVCSRGPFAFEFWNGRRWQSADELPPATLAALPEAERARCEAHRWRRHADRQAGLPRSGLNTRRPSDGRPPPPGLAGPSAADGLTEVLDQQGFFLAQLAGKAATHEENACR